MRKIGINMHAYPGCSHEEYVKKIAELGFEGTFTGVYPTAEEQAEVANILAAHSVAYETIHAPFGHINDIWLDKDEGEVMLGELKTTIDRCKLVGAPIAVVHLSAGDEAPTVTDIGRGRFEQLVDYAISQGVNIAFENQRKLANISWAFETFSPDMGVGFCWDCGHESCFTPGREYMPLFSKRLICLHIHDNHGKYNADRHMIPFDGKINYYRFAEYIQKSGYSGTLMLELSKKNAKGYYDDLTVDQYLERAQKAVLKLRDLVDGE